MSRKRDLTARSVILSVLLGTEPPRLPVQLLVRTTDLFGIADGTTRTALSRMVATGEIKADDAGYEIAAPRLLERQARQSESRAPTSRTWTKDRRWLQAVVVADGRRDAADRAALRTALTAARLAELREGVWLRPDDIGGARPDVGPEVRWFRIDPPADPAALAAELWDLEAWAGDAHDLTDRMETLLPRLLANDTSALADGFVLSADVLRHFQHDPLLPKALQPGGWPGTSLRRAYERYDRAYRELLRRWFQSAGSGGSPYR